MDEHVRANLEHWDEVVPIHAASKLYDLESFRAGKTSLGRIEMEELGDVSGRTLLHLQCHFGLDTLSWARVVAHFLRPGGTFYILESHPFAHIFADQGVDDLQVAFPYFSGEAMRFDSQGTYAEPEAVMEHTVTYEWLHSMAEIVNSLIRADLTIGFLHEFPFCAFMLFPFMDRGKDGYWRLKTGHEIPLMFSLKARKS